MTYESKNMPSPIDGLVQDAVEELISTLKPGRSERHYQEELAKILFQRIGGLPGLRSAPRAADDLREHGNVMSHWPGWTGRSGPRADLLVWRPKDSHQRRYRDLLPLEDCVAVEMKIEDGDADRGPNRLKWLPHACRPLGLPVPPDETDGRDYTETEATLIALRAYRELAGIGRAYLLLIGPPENFKLRLLELHVRIFEEALWRKAPSSGIRYLFQEAGSLWR